MKHMHVSFETVKLWIKQGAPIKTKKIGEGKTKYSAEKHELEHWLINRSSTRNSKDSLIYASDPIYLCTVRDFRKHMNVSMATVWHWAKKGAPIRIEETKGGKKKYRSEKHALMRWLINPREADYDAN